MSAAPHASEGRPEPGPDADTAAIRADIEQTRRELGETAEALAARLDVPAQTRAKVDEAKHRVAEKVEPVRRNRVPIVAAAVGGVVVLALLRRRRRRRRAELD